MSKIHLTALLAPLAVLATQPVAAQEREEEQARPAVIDGLYACQSVADAAQRLVCFDSAVERIKTDEAERKVIFADRGQVREAKRGLFGLGNIRLGIFSRGDDNPDEEQLDEIETKVRAVQASRDGKLMILLEDGARWQQTDGTPHRMRTLEAQTINIKRASLGGYIARLDGSRPFRVKRVQ